MKLIFSTNKIMWANMWGYMKEQVIPAKQGGDSTEISYGKTSYFL